MSPGPAGKGGGSARPVAVRPGAADPALPPRPAPLSQQSFPGVTRSPRFSGVFTRFMDLPRGARPGEMQTGQCPGWRIRAPALIPCVLNPGESSCTPQFKREGWSLPDPFQCWRRPPPPGAMGKGGENSHTMSESCSRRHAGGVTGEQGVLWRQRRGCPIRLWWGKSYNWISAYGGDIEAGDSKARKSKARNSKTRWKWIVTSTECPGLILSHNQRRAFE